MSVMPDITPPEPKPAQEAVKKETTGGAAE